MEKPSLRIFAKAGLCFGYSAAYSTSLTLPPLKVIFMSL